MSADQRAAEVVQEGERMTPDTERPWWQRSRKEWALRDAGHTPARILMTRYADEKGNNSDGQPALWKDVGRIEKYIDAESILRDLESLDRIRSAARAVVKEWTDRGDGGCVKTLQDQLRTALDG